MNNIIFIFSLILFGCHSSGSILKASIQDSQNIDCQKCDIELVKYVRSNIDSLKEEKVLEFLNCFNEVCFYDAEFAEAANYTLFVLLEKSPFTVLKSLSQNPNLSLNFIKKVLENPISEDINVKTVYKQLDDVKQYEEIKKKLLMSIKIAIEKTIN